MRIVIPPHLNPARRRAAIVRVVCMGIVVGSIAGLVFLTSAPSTQAATNADSALTISWANDTSAAKSFQPDRTVDGTVGGTPGGFEYDEFKNLKVTVNQTSDLIDQAVQVDMSGFPGGTTAGSEQTGDWTSAQNFMQAMQCWGPDPKAADFRNTCEWGGHYEQNIAPAVYSDNLLRVAAKDVSSTAVGATDVPFTSVDGQVYSGREQLEGGNILYHLFDVFNPSSTNEVLSATVNNDGSGSFDFEAQSANQAPQLGCGSPTHLSCWLVLVPRGSIWGGHDASCSSVGKPVTGQPWTYGEGNALQAGSPINPACDYWNNRMVVPLKFSPVTLPCASGAEQSVIGSQLVIGAMASWQPALCTAAGAPFSFVSNPDSVARAQILEANGDSDSSGVPHLAFTSYPLARADFSDFPDDQTTYDKTDLSYAPVAIGATVAAFTADGRRGQISSLVLSPRLLAKLLTQSYAFELPAWTSDAGTTDKAQLAAANQSYRLFSDDPEFRKLNANYGDFVSNPALVLPGPSGADAIKQIWKWIQSDADARDFLNGKADPWGMKVNPWYLATGSADAKVPTFDAVTGVQDPILKPVGNTNLDGSPLSLATTTLDYFPKFDGSQVPHVLGGAGQPLRQFDSVQASPYVDDFVKAARTTFRADPGAKITWSPNTINAAGDAGDWVSPGPQLAGSRFTISITDAAAAVRYDLPVASLQAANGTALSQPDTTAMATAISSGLTTTSSASVAQVDPAKVSAAGYPLTTVVYAAVNLSTTKAATRTTLSKMITYVAGAGQTLGTQTGQLPLGYLPLTPALTTQANAAAAAISSYSGSPASSSSNISQANDPYYAGSDASGAGAPGGAAAAGGPTTSAIDADTSGKTPRVDSPPIVQAGLGVSLGLGLIGALFSPALFRGRGRL